MDDEMNALIQNGTWNLVPPTLKMNMVGCKWVFRLKCNADRSIARHRATLVAKGFNKKKGVDYGEIFSPVVKPCTNRIVLSITLMHCWSIL